MKKVLCFQAAVLVFVLALAGLVDQSFASIISALLGGLCYLVPSIMMNLIVTWVQKDKENLSQAQKSFVYGESAKILLAVVLMALCIIWYTKLQWMWFFLSLVCVSKLIYFFIWKYSHYGSRNRKSSS